MTRRSPTAYEEFMAQLAGGLRARHSIEDIHFGAGNKLRGQSGVLHQVDVSFVEVSGAGRKLVLVECKSLKSDRRVNLGHVKVLKATADDLKESGVTEPIEAHFVSSVALQSGAATFACFYGIECHVLSDGPNWSFKYGQVVQVGLALAADSASVKGVATMHRQCRSCSFTFVPVGSERMCPVCVSRSVA